MIVFIKYATGIRRVVDVTLLRGFILKCRHVTEDRADPALWYKALVLDSILVDCDGQNVFWSTEGPPGNVDIHLCHESDLSVESAWSFFSDKESIFNEDECYDFDPAHNELFEIALDVFHGLSWTSVDKDGNSEAYEDLLKMLHVFILPRVKFTSNSRASVKNVLEEIEEHRVNFEKQIQEKDDMLKLVEDELHEKRVLLLEDGKFSRSDFVSTCDPDFLTLFLLHLEKFILKCNEELDMFDRKITPIRHSQIREHMDHLKALRYDRDALYKTVEKAVIAREEIRNVVVRRESRGISKGENSANHQIDAYLNVSKRIDRIKDTIQDLIRTKIKISSVREAVNLTLNEIDRDTYSYGYNSRTECFPDDVDMLHVTSKPKKWYTLTEKVALCLHSNENGIWSEHIEFCQQIELQCKRLCDESELFSFPTITKNPPQEVPSTLPDSALTTSLPDVITDIPGSPGIDQQCSPTATTEGSTIQNSRCSIEIVPKEKCRSICEDIVGHTTDMAVLIAKELCLEDTELTHNFVNKVYVCYEEYVSKKLLPVLNSLYQRSYLDTCPGLSAWLCNVRLSGGYLEEAKLADIIQPPGLLGTSSVFVSPEELSTESSSNETKIEEEQVRTRADRARTVGPRDVHEMYKMYNEMADSMPERFTAIFEHDTNLPVEVCFTSGTADDEVGLPAPCSNKLCAGTMDLHSPTSPQHAVTHSEASLDQNENEYLTPTAWTFSPELCKQSSQPQNDAYRSSSLKHRNVHPPLSKRFSEEFRDFGRLVEEEENSDTLFSKIHKTTQMLHYANTTLARLRKSHGVDAAVSADDLVGVFTSLLCTLDSQRVLRLYASVNMMDHLKPKFLKGDVHDYALVTLSVAFQNLFINNPINDKV